MLKHYMANQRTKFGFYTAHKNKIPTAMPMFSEMTLNGNNIHIARCRRHTGNKYGRQKSGSSFSSAYVAHITAI